MLNVIMLSVIKPSVVAPLINKAAILPPFRRHSSSARRKATAHWRRLTDGDASTVDTTDASGQFVLSFSENCRNQYCDDTRQTQNCNHHMMMLPWWYWRCICDNAWWIDDAKQSTITQFDRHCLALVGIVWHRLVLLRYGLIYDTQHIWH